MNHQTSRPRAERRGDLSEARGQFPILDQQVHGQPLVFLDSAASTQQPVAVIDAVADYHRRHHANIHRAVYGLSQTATSLYEAARARVAEFIKAAEPRECLFTRGTTEAINLVAATWGRSVLRPGDEIILSMLEHHANIVPWQMVAQATGASIKVIPIDTRGELDLAAYRAMLSEKTRLVAVTQVSNALGTINPVAEIIAQAHGVGALALIDGAQWVAHAPTDVQALDADFYAFSGHKLYGPTGIGVLYGKASLLETMPPYQGGGDMIEQVSFAGTSYASPPNRFEAGTPPIAGAVGLAAAMSWLGQFGFAAISAHERALLADARARIERIPGIEIKGQAAQHAGVLSFLVTDPPLAPLDIGTELDLRGICVRTGHHCCQPLMDDLGISGTVRASFALYNTPADVDRLVEGLQDILARARAARSSQRDALSGKGRAGRSAGPAVANCAVEPNTGGLTGIRYPQATAESPSIAAERLADDFALLADWPARHEYLIELGERLAPLPDALKTAENRVQGCQSTVYLSARVQPGATPVIEFLADSDAAIVRGLIAMLQSILSGQRVEALLGFDTEAFFTRIGLDKNLSLGRRNGLSAMVGRLRAFAREALP